MLFFPENRSKCPFSGVNWVTVLSLCSTSSLSLLTPGPNDCGVCAGCTVSVGYLKAGTNPLSALTSSLCPENMFVRVARLAEGLAAIAVNSQRGGFRRASEMTFAHTVTRPGSVQSGARLESLRQEEEKAGTGLTGIPQF